MENSFFRMPKALFTDEKFSKLSSEAKLLYGILLDRTSLSEKNGWTDKDGRVYIYFTIEETMSSLNICRNKVFGLHSELADLGLISKKRQGLGKPAMIYVTNLNQTSRNPENQTSRGTENETSRSPENKLQEVYKTNSNNTDINNNNFSNTDMNNILSDKKISDKIKDRDLSLQKIHRRIEYNILIKNFNKAVIDSIVKVMLDAVCSKKEMLSVGGRMIPQKQVRSRLMELDGSHIEYVIECMDNCTTNIRSLKHYLLTALYNAPITIDAYYEAQVRRDMHAI